MGVGAQPLLDAALPAIEVPLCLVVGEEDTRFCEAAEALARLLPRARIERIPEAGHAAHLENRAEFLAVSRRFFAEASRDTHSG